MIALDKRIIIASILVLVGLVSALALVGPMIIHHTNQITVTGSLQSGVEAGCVILHANNGTQYLLTGWSNYPPAGTTVTVTGYVDTGVASYCMQGNVALHVVSIATTGTTTSFSISYGTGSLTASSATVISGSTEQSTSITGVPITASGYVYTIVESPQCYPQCGAPSFFLTYLYIAPGTECTGMACYPPPQYYRLLNSDGRPFLANAPNGTYVTSLTGLLVTPSSWNCESLYIPKICMFGDVYVQNVEY
jgi:hypothetical protein